MNEASAQAQASARRPELPVGTWHLAAVPADEGLSLALEQWRQEAILSYTLGG